MRRYDEWLVRAAESLFLLTLIAAIIHIAGEQVPQPAKSDPYSFLPQDFTCISHFDMSPFTSGDVK